MIGAEVKELCTLHKKNEKGLLFPISYFILSFCHGLAYPTKKEKTMQGPQISSISQTIQ